MPPPRNENQQLTVCPSLSYPLRAQTHTDGLHTPTQQKKRAICTSSPCSCDLFCTVVVARDSDLGDVLFLKKPHSPTIRRQYGVHDKSLRAATGSITSFWCLLALPRFLFGHSVRGMRLVGRFNARQPALFVPTIQRKLGFVTNALACGTRPSFFFCPSPYFIRLRWRVLFFEVLRMKAP